MTSTRHPTARVGAEDLRFLASERGSTLMQVGAILMLDAPVGLDPTLVAKVVAHRITAVPRLHQRLLKIPGAAVGQCGSSILTSPSATSFPSSRALRPAMTAQPWRSRPCPS
jgi:hypothetical protein